MADFDPSVLRDIGSDAVPDVAAAQGRALTLADLYDQNKLSKIKVKEAQDQQSDMTYAKQILAGRDLTKLDQQNEAVSKITQRNPQLGMELMRSFQGQQQGKAELDRSQLDLLKAKGDVIGGALYQMKEKHDAIKQQNPKATEQQIHDAMQEDVIQIVQGLSQQKLPNGQPLLDDNDRRILSEGLGKGYNVGFVDAMVQRSEQGRTALAAKYKALDETRKDKDEDRKERATNAAIATGQARTRMAEDSKIDPEDAQFMAEQYWAGDKSIFTGLGRGAQGAANIITVRKAIREEGKKRNAGPADLAAKLAEYSGYVASQRALGTRLANIETASEEAVQMLEVAKQASAAVPRGTFKPWNSLVKGSDVITNDPAYAKFAAATLAVVNTWARAISPTGVPTVADKEHANEVLNTAQSMEAYQAVLDQFKTEIDVALQAPESTKQRLHDAFIGKGSAPAASPGSATPPGAAGGPAGAGPPPTPGFVVQGQ